MPTPLRIEDGGTGNWEEDRRNAIQQSRWESEQRRLKAESEQHKPKDEPEHTVNEPEAERKPELAIEPKNPLRSPRITVHPLAGRLTGIAVRLLPSADRLRYAEEYQAELSDLSQISRWAQWAYAVRLIASAPMLRRELRSSARIAAGR